MKKVFILLFTLSTLFNINAQKNKQDEGLKIGIKGGLNVSNLLGDVNDISIRTSVHLGLLSEIIINDKFSIQPELQYSGQGVSSTNGRMKLDYIILPVLAKIYIANRLSIETGPQLGLLVSTKRETNISSDKIENIKTIDFGLAVGLSYDLKNGVFFQTRYILGLTDTGFAGTEYRASNSIIQTSIGIQF
jgi:hypothetical protein